MHGFVYGDCRRGFRSAETFPGNRTIAGAGRGSCQSEQDFTARHVGKTERRVEKQAAALERVVTGAVERKVVSYLVLLKAEPTFGTTGWYKQV